MFVNYSPSQINMPAVLIANGLGISLMLAVLLGRHRRTRMASIDGKIFYGMCLICVILCTVETAGFWLDGQQFLPARQLSILCNVLDLCLAAILSFLWICYVDYRLFQDRARILKAYLFGAIPAALICVAAVINLFSGVFFWVTEDNVYYRTPLFLLPCVVMYCYITYGAVLAYRYRKQVDKYLFMPVLALLIPVYLGSMIQLFHYGIALIWVSVALGLMFVYISLQNEDTYLDPLTDLYNRNYLMHFLDQIPKQKRAGITIIGIMLDVNNFKLINDTYGHMKGDDVLRAVGKILLHATSDSQAIVVRYGGDEFLVLLPASQRGQISRIQKNISEELDRYNSSGETPVPVSFSAGISELQGMDLFQFFQNMDRAMYQEKRAFYLNVSEEADPCSGMR